MDGLQIVLCDDRRPEEPANISRRTIGRGSIRIPRTNERTIDRRSSMMHRADALETLVHSFDARMGVYRRGDDGPYPSSLRPNIDPSCPSMVAHGVRTMKRSHLPPRPANTLPDPYRKSAVWADVAPQCKPSCQTASILQRRSNPSRSTFPPSSWIDLPSPPPYSSHFYPFLFPRFSYLLLLLLYICGLSLSFRDQFFRTAFFCSIFPRIVSPHRLLLVPRSFIIVHRLLVREPLEFLELEPGRLHIIEVGRYAHAVPRRLPLRPVPACRRGVVADQRPPGVPTCSVRTRSRGRMHTRPCSRRRWCSATSATTKVRDLSLLAVTYCLWCSFRSRAINLSVGGGIFARCR